MRQLIFTVLFLLQCTLALASPTALVLDLDDEINTDLLSHTEYHLDESENLTFDLTAQLPNSFWQPFDRDQLRFGFTDSPVWLRTTIKTTGTQSKKLSVALHKGLSSIVMSVSKDGEASKLHTFNRQISRADQSSSNVNSSLVTLVPNSTYQLVLEINSESPVIGNFYIIEPYLLADKSAQVNQWVITALILICLVAVFNATVFVTSRHPTIISHLCYVLSILGYLLNDYGYLQKWMAVSQPATIQKFSAVFLIMAILSLITFFRSMSSQEGYSRQLGRVYKLLFYCGYALIPLMFLLPFQNLLHLIILFIVASVAVCSFHAVLSWKNRDNNQSNEGRSLSLTLLIVLATLVPSVTIHILSRRGIIDVLWYTEFVLFASIIIEVVLISIVLFLNIRKNKKAYDREVHTNNISNLPNSRSLEKYLAAEPLPHNKAIIQIWVSGLDEMQVAFGPEPYRDFLRDTANQMSQGLIEIPGILKLDDEHYGETPLFHSDKNTFTMLSARLNKASQKAILEQLGYALETMSNLHHINIDLKAFIGGYQFDQRKCTLSDALVNSNLALAHSIKHNKKFKMYNPQMSFDERQRLALINDFKDSLDNDEFFLLWQPQYDTQTTKIIGVEVLSRWQHEQYGLISPDLFIPLLEQSNRICELSYWVIDEVLRQLPTLHQSHPGIEVSINLSPRDLIGDHLITFLDSKLKSHARLIPFITFEITETLLIDDYSDVLKNVEKLQSRGFNISIDDFGSGYSSFAYLQKLPANELKIDKIYTDSYLESSSNAILESMIYMAKRLDMRIVVEGIEHQQQIDLFKKLGAERLQGWMLDKPMSLNALLDKNTITV